MKESDYIEPQWISRKAIPAVGETINVRINGIGASIVKKYFVEHGFIALLVQPINPPAWYVKQNGANEPCHVFPAEVEELRDLEAMASKIEKSRESCMKALTPAS